MSNETGVHQYKHDPRLNHSLFQKYIVPNLDFIHSLVFFYIHDKAEVESVYNFVLEMLYRYIHDYDPTKKLDTWIHFATKNYVKQQNLKMYNYNTHKHGIVYDFDRQNDNTPDELLCGGGDNIDFGTIVDQLSDKTLSALQRTPPHLLSAFILYFQGHSVEDIVEIEYKRGYIDKTGKEGVRTIMGRIYQAKRIIKDILEEYGIRKTSDIRRSEIPRRGEGY